jgi:hypothetical protein
MWPCLCALYALCAVGRADVNSRNKRGNTPLMQAAEKGRVTVVQALLDAKADPTLTNPRRLTAREVSSVPVSPGSALARPPPLSGPAMPTAWVVCGWHVVVARDWWCHPRSVAAADCALSRVYLLCWLAGWLCAGEQLAERHAGGRRAGDAEVMRALELAEARVVKAKQAEAAAKQAAAAAAAAMSGHSSSSSSMDLGARWPAAGPGRGCPPTTMQAGGEVPATAAASAPLTCPVCGAPVRGRQKVDFMQDGHESRHVSEFMGSEALRIMRDHPRHHYHHLLEMRRLRKVSHFCACIGSPCLRQCVHGASIGGVGVLGGARCCACAAAGAGRAPAPRRVR